MRILLVGEYSRLHNSLKEGLQEFGHEVVVMASGDGFKNYPVDVYINHSFHNKLLKKLKVLIYKLTSIDLGSIQMYLRAKKQLKALGDFDIVQLINESAINVRPKFEIKFIKQLLIHTNKLYLLSCGIDYMCMSHMMNKGFRYSIMSPYLEDKSLKKTYKFQLIFLTKPYKKLHDFIIQNCDGVIASDIDYHIPYKWKEKYLGLIPNPINTEKIKFSPLKINGKIKIFHGVNKSALHKKGSHYFFDALEIIKKKYSEKVDIQTVYSLPYNEYIKIYDSCHILLDQVMGYDQGYNALEAMAKGKVVFTGAEQEWLEYYNLKENTVAINALPEASSIAQKLEWLILNPHKIEEISRNARSFIENEHDYKRIAEQYLIKWTK